MTDTLRYLLVLDFEATCGESDFPRNQMEVIEFPTLAYDLQEKKEVGKFHEYVKPVIRPQLTEFCTNLTGITQVSSFRVSSPRLPICVPHTGDRRRRRSFPTCLGSLQGVSERPKPVG